MTTDTDKALFMDLLQNGAEEQVYQAFIEANTKFIPREFVQNHGIAQGLVLRKLSFGADYKTDFFYFSKSTDDWNAVFIEIEKPTSRFFKRNSNNFHNDFLKALQQINQWKAWFLSDQNKGAFLASVSALQVPEHMARNPTFNKYVLVFGRRSEYEGNEDRRRLIRASETDDFKIISFDSLLEDLDGKCPLTIGSRHNQFIDILTDEVTHVSLYAWMEPTQLRVSVALREKLRKGGSGHYVFGPGGPEEVLSRAAVLVRTRSE